MATTPLTRSHRQPSTIPDGMVGFDLAKETEILRSEPEWASGRNAKTLVKFPDFRIVLVVLKAGVVIHEHRTAGRISVQTLAGRIRMHVHEQTLDLPHGSVLILDHAVKHDIEAVEESAFLLTIAWDKT